MATATKRNPKDHFRFWFPIDKLEKSVDKKGNAVMKIGGIASTGRKDTDDEIMDTNGFQLDYFEERGIINWNHSQKPDHVIGEPTKVENRDAGLYVESMLYPTNKLAKSAYELAETLNKHSKRRRLGYSIEGKVLSRDPNDPRKVKKALITNLALTISPKNADSLVDIIKGNYHEIEDYEYEIEKSVNFSEANGGQQYIIDITRPDGMRVTVDSDLNISIKKALDTDSGRAVIREDLEGKKKNLSKSEKYLTWDECIEKIKSTNSVIDVEKANIFIDKLNNLAMATKNSKTSITDDLLSKALKNVGILTPSKVKKSNAGDDDEEDDEDDENETQAGGDDEQNHAKRLSKGNREHEEEDEDEEEEEEEEEKPKKKKPIKKANKGQRIANVTVVDDSNTELIKSVGIIAKAALDEVKGLRKENQLLKSQFDDLSEQLEDVLSTPANGRKSLSKPVNKNFKKSLGADEEDDDNEDARVLSLSRDKNQILDMLDDQAFNKGNVDDFVRNQMTSFEVSNKINKSMVEKLEREYNIKIVA